MSKPRILIAEDERIVAEDIKRTIERFGYAISSITSSSEETVKKAQEERPDLVLMDIVLEGESDGIEAAQQIRDRLSIPVVFLTAFADEGLLMRAKITEPYSYILKPFQDRELYAAIEIALSKHAIEMKLIKSEATLQAILDASPIGIGLVKNRVIDWANKAMYRMVGHEEGALLGKSTRVLYGSDEEYERVSQELYSGINRSGMGQVETQWVRKDSTSLNCFLMVQSLDRSDYSKGHIVSVTDTTERKKAEEELKNSQDELRNLATYLQSAREQERTSIAREIHDELGQALTGLKMDLSWMAKKIPEDQKSLLDKVHSMSELTGTTLRTVQRISTELRPGLLDDLGLVAAAEWQIEEFQNRTGIRSKLTVDPEDITLDDRRSTALFRILQETLTNVARHTQATRVHVSLKEKGKHLKLRVRDNGKGITKEQISDPKSFGLIGIRERAKSCGGEVKISDRSGKGTTVVVRMPM